MYTPHQNKIPDANAPAIALWSRRLVISLTILVWIVLAIILWWLLGYITSALIVFAIASLLAYALYPAVKIFQRFMSRHLAILSVYLVVLIGLSVLMYILASTTVRQLVQLVQFMQVSLSGGPNEAFAPIVETLAQFGISQEQLRDGAERLVVALEGLAGRVVPLVSSVFNIFINVLLVATLSIYILFDGPRVMNWLRQKTPRTQRSNITFLVETIKRVAGGYIRGQLLMSTILSSVTGIAMALIGVPYAVFIGVLAFALSFIPVIGAFVTGIICILLALTKGWIIALIALAFLLFLQILEGQILGPRILGPAVGLHPIVSLFALLVGGNIFGITGALFASIIAGFVQAILVAAWTTWRDSHPDEFQEEVSGGTQDIPIETGTVREDKPESGG